MKIVVAGLGGVGGFFGGKLALHYHNHPGIEINFLSRGKNLDAILRSGLTVTDNDSSFTAIPHRCTNDPREIGKSDLLLLCVKSYHLESTLPQLRDVIHPDTTILPLMNGIDPARRIQEYFPQSTVLPSCVYIVSRLTHPGMISCTGSLKKIYYGYETGGTTAVILRAAGIDIENRKDIDQLIWDKFIFISPLATATSYFDSNIGELRNDPRKLALFKELLKEIMDLARAKGFEADERIRDSVIHRIHTLPVLNTSSMHSDFQAGRPETEIGELTGYVIRTCREYGIECPAYLKCYNTLVAKNAS